MASIKCEACSAKRSNVQYKNTKFCHPCRMLRDLVFVGLLTRKCGGCAKSFAPVVRRDPLCGKCHYGNIYQGTCVMCGGEDVDLHRPGVAVCVKCVRDPDARGRVVAALRKGQKSRRLENAYKATTTP